MSSAVHAKRRGFEGEELVSDSNSMKSSACLGGQNTSLTLHGPSGEASSKTQKVNFSGAVVCRCLKACDTSVPTKCSGVLTGRQVLNLMDWNKNASGSCKTDWGPALSVDAIVQGFPSNMNTQSLEPLSSAEHYNKFSVNLRFRIHDDKS